MCYNSDEQRKTVFFENFVKKFQGILLKGINRISYLDNLNKK